MKRAIVLSFLIGCFFSALADELIFLTDGRGYGSPFLLNKDKEIIFTKFDYDAMKEDIWVMDINGKNQKKLIENAKTPSVSPAGNKIAFVSTKLGEEGLWIMDINGNKKNLLFKGFVMGVPRFSPDGKKIIFSSFYAGSLSTCQMDTIDSKNFEIIIKKGVNPSFSPDGSKIVFVRDNKIWMVNIDTGEEKKLTEIDGIEMCPDWSSDGKKIIFVHQTYQPLDNLVLFDLEKMKLKYLTSGPTGARDPHFFPDDKRIIFTGKDRNGNDNICLITLN